MFKKSWSVLLKVSLGVMLISLFIRAQVKKEGLALYLEETPHLDFNNQLFSEVLSNVVSEDMSLEQKLEKLFYFTRDSITFVPDASLKASEALKKRKAVCYTKAMIYVSFCRRLGVPASLALEEFVIKESSKQSVSAHGIARIFYNGKWIYIDTASNREAWTYWHKEGAAVFEAPKFSLEHNVVADEKFISRVAYKNFETNDVPQAWLDSLQNFQEKGKWK